MRQPGMAAADRWAAAGMMDMRLLLGWRGWRGKGACVAQ